VEDWAEIRRLYRSERMPIKIIARVVGCSRNTVKKAIAADISTKGRVVQWRMRWSRGFGSCCTNLVAVSASSASRPESATTPAPANRWTRLPSSAAEPRGMPNSPSPLASIHPTGPA
jgi:hypothetical protein